MQSKYGDLDWLIIGGGFHGTHLSLRLLNHTRSNRHKIRVLDPHPKALWMWNHCTRNTGMKFLRSTIVHHMGMDPMDLKKFPGKQLRKRKLHDKYFQGKYLKPQYELFQRHCRKVIAEHKLEELRIQGRAIGFNRTGNGWIVETDKGTLNSKHIVLALGLSEQPRWPEWSKQFRHEGSPVQHIFDPTFDVKRIPSSSKVAVVGGGITAAQVTIKLAEYGINETVLINRNPLTCHQFDSDPCYIGDKCMRNFRRQKCLEKRRALIKEARYPGSLTPEVRGELLFMVKQGKISHLQHEISDANYVRNKTSQIELTDINHASIGTFDRVILCTGFEQGVPGGTFITDSIRSNDLPIAPCGYPVVSVDLEWSKNLFVMGPLAELEMGPTSRNITGARQAAQRIVSQI